MYSPKLPLILLIITTVFCFYVMNAVSRTSATLLVVSERIMEAENIPEEKRTHLSKKLSKREKEMEIINTGMIALIPFLGLGIGSCVYQLNKNKSNKIE